jgi:predicted ribosomally synthesized peptide with SipW-like signal peptide
MEEPIVMKKMIALAVIGIASQTVTAFAGPPETKQVIAPPPPPPEFFRPNEFDIGAFATWAPFTGINNAGNGNANVRGWGGGMDFTYWFPWKYAGVRFQGTGMEIQSSGFNTTITPIVGLPSRTVHVPGGNVGAGVLVGDALLRLPLDAYWPNVHLAPYLFGGFGGIIVGSGSSASFNETATVTGPVTVTGPNGAVTTVVPAGQTRTLRATGRRLNAVRNNIGTDRVLGQVGGGLEYRFTPNIGIFTEASYNIVNGADNNFVQFNFIGLRYAF